MKRTAFDERNSAKCEFSRTALPVSEDALQRRKQKDPQNSTNAAFPEGEKAKERRNSNFKEGGGECKKKKRGTSCESHPIALETPTRAHDSLAT